MNRVPAFLITALITLAGAATNRLFGGTLFKHFLGTLRLPSSPAADFVAVIVVAVLVYAGVLFVLSLVEDTLTAAEGLPEAVVRRVSVLYGATSSWIWWFIGPIFVLEWLVLPRALDGRYLPLWWILALLAVASLPTLPRFKEEDAVTIRTRSNSEPARSKSVAELLDTIRTNRAYRYQGQIAAIEQFPGGVAVVSPAEVPVLAEGSPARYALPLSGSGGPSVYSHQAKVSQLLDRPSSGEARPPVALATPVSSGRWTIALSVILDRVLSGAKTVLVLAPDPGACKQHLDHLQRLLDESGWSWSVAISSLPTSIEYDRAAEQRGAEHPLPEIIFTTADVLHERLLPEWEAWEPYLAQLDLLVTLNTNQWNGLYGANCAYVFRRLLRLCSHLDARPQVLAISDPASDIGSFLSRLFGSGFREQDIVEVDGAALNERVALYWNPPLTTDIPPKRSSLARPYLAEVQDVVAMLAGEGRRPIVYAADLPLTSSDLNRVKHPLERALPDAPVPVVRDIEELPFPLGERDTIVVCGNPGCKQILDHRTAHLGKGQSDAGLIWVIPPRQPLPQFFLRRAEDRMMNTGDEHDAPLSAPFVALSLGNPRLIQKHILCAAAEHWLTDEEIAAVFGQEGTACSAQLVDQGLLGRRDGQRTDGRELIPEVRYFSLSNAHARQVDDLKTTGGNTIQLVDANTGECVRRIDADICDLLAYEGAILLIDDQRYQVHRREGDFQRGRIELAQQNSLIGSQRVRSLQIRQAFEGSCPGREFRIGRGLPVTLYHGDVDATETLSGVNLYGDTVINGAEGHMQHRTIAPTEISIQTRALLVGFNEEDNPDIAVLHTLAHACRTFLPLIVTCDASEVSIDYDEHCEAAGGAPVLAIYETVPGGIGAVDMLAREIHTLLGLAYEGLSSCPCLAGCDACLFTPDCNHDEPNGLLDKQRTLRLLRLILTPPDAQEFTQEVEDPDVLRHIQRRLVALFRTRLGVDIARPATIRFFNPQEAASPADGFFIPASMEISIRHRSYERTVAIVAHESAHNWQFEPDHMTELLREPDIPYDGLLFLEGFAEWMEYKALDIYGLFRGMKEIQFIHNDEYGAGFAVLRWLEDQYGVQGVLDFMCDGPNGWNLDDLYRNAGVTPEMRATWQERKDAGLPPFVIDWVGLHAGETVPEEDLQEV